MKKNEEYLQLRIPQIVFKTIPIWMVIFLVLNSSMLVGLSEYYLMKKNFSATFIELEKKTKSPEELALILKQQVIPQKGFTLGVVWKDIGKQLLDTGAIDKVKFEELFMNDVQAKTEMKYLTNSSADHMAITERNSRFMVNVLWALGLVNKSKVLDEGSMNTVGNGSHMNYASTGGWNLGSRPTGELYSSEELISLTPDQEILVNKIARTVYRPCCNNSVEFPDCNHGMAALGYIELAVKQGLTEEKIYKDVLALNSFWFQQTYGEQAVFFQQQGKEWSNVDPKIALSSQYSSAQGSEEVKKSVQNIPGLQIQGGGCSA